MMPCPEGASRTSRYLELGPAVAVLGAWAALAVLATRGGRQAGMDMGPPRAGVLAATVAGLPSWLLMTVAMMGPAALPRFGYVGRSGSRPVRAMAGFAVAYLGVWTAFGLAAQAAAAVPGVPSPRALALALLAALAWQLSPVRRSLLRGCHANLRPPLAGSMSAAQSVAYGARYGLCCLGACWCLMVVMVAVPAGQLLWLAGLTAVITAERLLAEPGAVTRAAAAVLGVAAVATLAVGGLLQ